MVKIFTIGFTGKSAEVFFEKLRGAGVTTLVDIRLNNTSQLAGFTKAKDLKYFCKAIADIVYIHMPEFAPTKELLDGYKKGAVSWEEYCTIYNTLLVKRNIIKHINIDDYNMSCLLCSEQQPIHCHRSLASQHLANSFSDITISHL